jgi:hypothetical protein
VKEVWLSKTTNNIDRLQTLKPFLQLPARFVLTLCGIKKNSRIKLTFIRINAYKVPV